MSVPIKSQYATSY